MTATDMVILLYTDGFCESHKAWESFCREMRDKQHGIDALNQAWWFFRRGWEESRGAS